MTKIKVFEIEKYTRGFCEGVENALEENQFFGTIEKAREKLNEIYNECYEDEIEEGDENIPPIENDQFIINGWEELEIYRIVEKEISIF